MIKPDYAIYLAEDTDKIHTDILTNDSFYIIAAADAGVGKDHVREALDKTKEELLSNRPEGLSEFEAQIDKLEELIGEGKNLALAGALVAGSILYLVTRGKGVVYIKRKQTLKKIVSGHNIASGHLQEGDSIVLTTEKLTDLISEVDLNDRIDENKPKDVIDDITIHFKKQHDEGLIMFLLRFTKGHVSSVDESVKEKTIVEEQPDLKISVQDGQGTPAIIKKYIYLFLKIVKGRKKAALIASVVILGILLWSVVLGQQRKTRREVLDKISTSSEIVQKKLDDAEEVASLDLSRALKRVAEARKEVTDVANFAGSKNLSDLKELKELEKRVSEEEKKVRKKEDKKFTEYYELALISSDAVGSGLYLYEDIIEIMDVDAGRIYTVSTDTKAKNTFSDPNIKKASGVAAYLDKLYFVDTNKGIYEKKADEKKASLVIEKDNWGDIVDFGVYNGNIYLLDSGSDEIYKYLVAESGFSKKTSYFRQDQSIDLSNATSMSIDGAIYIATNDTIYKYVSGIRQNFNLNLPEKINIEKVFTSKDLDSLYLWDKSAGKVVVVSKEGEYKKQIVSSMIKKGESLIVLPDGEIIILYKDKLYKIE